MRAFSRPYSSQPPGAAAPASSPFLSTELRVLWSASALPYNAASGQWGVVNTPENVVYESNVAGLGASFGSATLTGVAWSNMPTTANSKFTAGVVVTPAAGSQTQVLIATTGNNDNIYCSLTSAGTTFQVTKGNIITFITLSVTLGQTYWIRTSHDEATDEWWVIATNLLTGAISSATGTNTGTATAGNGTYYVGGWGTTRSSPSILHFASFDAEFMPIALGYAWENPWESFEPFSQQQTVAAAGGTVVNVPTGTLTLTGIAPTVLTPRTVAVPTGALTLTGIAPTVLTPRTIPVPTGALTLTGIAPTVRTGALVQVPTGALTLTGIAPTVKTTGLVSVPTGTLTLTGIVPTVLVSGGAAAIPLGNFGWDAVRLKKKRLLQGLREELIAALDDSPSKAEKKSPPEEAVVPIQASPALREALTKVKQAAATPLALRQEISALRVAIRLVEDEKAKRKARRRRIAVELFLN